MAVIINGDGSLHFIPRTTDMAKLGIENAGLFSKTPQERAAEQKKQDQEAREAVACALRDSITITTPSFTLKPPRR